jgi:hypothetical protein
VPPWHVGRVTCGAAGPGGLRTARHGLQPTQLRSRRRLPLQEADARLSAMWPTGVGVIEPLRSRTSFQDTSAPICCMRTTLGPADRGSVCTQHSSRSHRRTGLFA